MCRWIAYTGPPLLMEELVLKPKYSLIEQSYSCREGAEPTNGDGFGLGWYSDKSQPGVFRSTEPAWNDRNLASLAKHVRSRLFIAHVRATTGTPIQQTNCHPFCYGNWMLAHNGLIAEFHRLRRELAFAIEPALFPLVEGSTDSEIMFYLALTFGLEKEPVAALEKMAGFVEQVGRRQGVEHPLQMTLALSDGQRLFAVRYSSQHASRTLYHNANLAALQQVNPAPNLFAEGAVAVVSEPLDNMVEHWVKVPESSLLTVENGKVTTQNFQPRTNG